MARRPNGKPGSEGETKPEPNPGLRMDARDTARAPLDEKASNLATRLNSGDLERACVQTAVMMSYAVGRRARKPEIYRRWAAESMLGFLRDTYANVRYYFPDIERPTGEEGAAWTNALGSARLVGTSGGNPREQLFDPLHTPYLLRRTDTDSALRRFCGAIVTRTEGAGSEVLGVPAVTDLGGPFDLDVVLSCIDGSTAATEGRPGTSVSLAAGVPGTFGCSNLALNPADLGTKNVKASESYCVFVIGRAGVARFDAHRLRLGRPLLTTVDKSFACSLTEHAIEESQILQDIAHAVTDESPRPAIAVLGEGPLKSWHWYTQQRDPPLRMLRVDGSAVAAAATVCLGKHDLQGAVMFCRSPQLRIIALISLVTGAEILAIPATPAGRSYRFEQGAPILRARDVVHGNNAFAILTGVTPSIALNGVEFEGDTIAKVQSLVFSLATGGIKRQRFSFDLKEGWFRGVDGTQRKATSVLRAFFENQLELQPFTSGPFAPARN